MGSGGSMANQTMTKIQKFARKATKQGGIALLLASFSLTACKFDGAAIPTNPTTSSGASPGSNLSQKFSDRATLDWSRCEAVSFNGLKDLNVFVTGNFTAPSSDVQGRLAVGGNAFIMNYSVGDQLPADENRDDLIVNGNLDFRSGAVMNGAATYGGSLITTQSASVYGGLTQQLGVLDFGSLTAKALDLSVYLGTMRPTGDVAFESYSARGFTNMSGANSTLNIFAMTAEDLERTHTMNISAPASSTAVVNIYGSTATMSSFAINLSGVKRDHVIFNFVDATRLYVSNISIEGSILAPRAVVQFPSGQLNGHFVGASMEGSGQFNHVPFDGCLPDLNDPPPTPTPTPTPTATPTPSPSATPTPTPTPTATPPPTGSNNCTYTIGYWKNHSSNITPLLPQSLGLQYSGSKRLLVTTSAMAVDVLSQDIYGDASNGITKLYAQLLAAKLNVQQGASSSAVATSFSDADSFLGQYNFNDWSTLSSTVQNQILSVHETLDVYNNGNIGPGHCN